MPDYVRKNAAASAVWFEELERVIAHGITDEHSSTFARYCCLEAALRQEFEAGNLPRGNFLSEVRKLSELLGISGLAGSTSGTPINPVDQDGNRWGELPSGE